MKRLYLAEKPDLGRSIVAVLPEPHTQIAKMRNAVKVGNGDVVAWLRGHLLAQASPEAYGFQKWDLDALPIIPEVWQMVVRQDTRDFYENIASLLKEAGEVVNAGDPGREGQLLVDELIEFCGYRGPVLRILINDTNPEPVKEAIEAIEPNDKYSTLRDSALARARADWVLGMNMTRCYTKLAQMSGFQGVLKIGRVKTPLTALVARRCKEIENFKPLPYIQASASISFPAGKIRARWVSGETQAGVDEAGRLVDPAVAEDLKKRLEGKTAGVVKCERTPKRSAPPLGYSLTSLQIDCSRKFKIPAHETLSICQALYESGITTYPRSSCEYLPERQHAQAPEIMENILCFLAPESAARISQRLGADLKFSCKHKVYNEKKVGEHHAIVPTARAKVVRKLTGHEEKVFELIAARYLSFFLPDFEYNETKIEIAVEGEIFAVGGRQTIKEGWKVLTTGDEDDEDEKGKDDEQDVGKLPPVNLGDAGTCNEIILAPKKTTPPPYFTEAGLLAAMKSIGRFVKDQNVKKILQDTDGLGTEATRSGILKELFDSEQFTRQGDKIVASGTAKTLIDVLPEEITLPDLTASWESSFRRVQEGEISLDAAMKEINDRLSSLIAAAIERGPVVFPASTAGTSGAKDKKPKTPAKASKGKQSGAKCPQCGADMRRREGAKGAFWGCTKYPECRCTLPDKDGKPGAKGK